MKIKVKQFLKRFIAILVMLFAIILCFTMLDDRPTFADSGFSTSHSSSSHSSSSHSSSSHSSGSSFSSGRSRSSSSSSSSSSSGGDAIGGVMVFIIMFIIIFIIAKTSENKNKSPYAVPRNINLDDTAIENNVKKYLPDFNKKEFLDNGYKMYCDIQEAWMNFKLEDVRNLITDELFTMYESQLSTLEVKGEQNIMKDFVLKSSRLKDVAEQNGTITISTIYVIEFYDYIADVNTGKTIRGESKRKMRVTYEMKFRKTLDENAKLDNCPNCGAPVDINSAGICKYCNAKLVSENTKWVLTEKKALNQDYI